MTPLLPGDRNRLARVLGMLGSPHAGERDAAALAADRLVRGKGLDWLDVLGGGMPEPPMSKPGWQGPAVPDYMADVRLCQRHTDQLTMWELGFVSSLGQQRTVSKRQRDILAAITARFRPAGGRPA